MDLAVPSGVVDDARTSGLSQAQINFGDKAYRRKVGEFGGPPSHYIRLSVPVSVNLSLNRHLFLFVILYYLSLPFLNIQVPFLTHIFLFIAPSPFREFNFIATTSYVGVPVLYCRCTYSFI